jgi:hypothetical protein
MNLTVRDFGAVLRFVVVVAAIACPMQFLGAVAANAERAVSERASRKATDFIKPPFQSTVNAMSVNESLFSNDTTVPVRRLDAIAADHSTFISTTTFCCSRQMQIATLVPLAWLL